MDFNEAMNTISSLIEGLEWGKYDGIIVKKLEASNTLDEGRTSNQTHIAICGQQMDMFPYISASGYFDCEYENKDEKLKKYFTLQIPFCLYEDNIKYLSGARDELKISHSEMIDKVNVCVFRSRRKKGTDQLQLSLTALDSEEFISFRKLLHVGDYLVILKKNKKIEYDCIGIKQSSVEERKSDIDKLNNKFYKLETITTVPIESYVKEESTRTEKAENLLFYGVPGSGKSFAVNQMCSDEQFMERVVFHPDYTYSDFVGQILPRLNDENKLEYVFTEGPFTRILKKATNDCGHMYYLIIEEINRGNAPAIFGEIFQLLDRKPNGESEYGITNYDIAKAVYSDIEKLVKIPSNLTLIATMNTSDQNVFTLDTAFQRRWKMRHIVNDFNNQHSEDMIEGTEISWGAFAETINEVVMEENVDPVGAGDKRLGAYFAKKDELNSKEFPEKVLKYLWDDAFRMDKEVVFDERFKSLDSIIETYNTGKMDKLQTVLRASVYRKMLERTQQQKGKSIEE